MRLWAKLDHFVRHIHIDFHESILILGIFDFVNANRDEMLRRIDRCAFVSRKVPLITS